MSQYSNLMLTCIIYKLSQKAASDVLKKGHTTINSACSLGYLILYSPAEEISHYTYTQSVFVSDDRRVIFVLLSVNMQSTPWY